MDAASAVPSEIFLLTLFEPRAAGDRIVRRAGGSRAKHLFGSSEGQVLRNRGRGGHRYEHGSENGFKHFSAPWLCAAGIANLPSAAYVRSLTPTAGGGCAHGARMAQAHQH
jgi:hypothetical protein